VSTTLRHPRDTYTDLEAIWLSMPSYLEKRMPLEQAMIDNYSIQDLQLLDTYLARTIDKEAEKLRRMKAIHSISTQVIKDRLLDI
jgi:hypothetical protein